MYICFVKAYVIIWILLGVCMFSCQTRQDDLLQEKLQQAERYIALGDYEEAVWILKQAEEHIDRPSQVSAQIFFALSRLNHEGGDYEKAIHYQGKAQAILRQLPPESSLVMPKTNERYDIGWAKGWELNGQTERAESLYIRVIQAMPEDAYFAYYNLASLYDGTSRTELADSLYQVALQMGNFSLRQAVSQTLYHRDLQRKDTAAAIIHLRHYAALMDSLTYVPGKEKILSIQARYDQEMAVRKKVEMQRNYLLLFIVTSILAGAIVYGWRKKVRKEREDSRNALLAQQEITQEKEFKINQLKAIQGLRKEDVSLTREQITAFDYFVHFKETPTSYSAKEDREKLACWLDMAHNDFATRLNESFPNLTPRELDICYLHRLGYSVWEIKEILGMAQLNSVTKAISRTCSKLQLDSGQKSLSEFILNF